MLMNDTLDRARKNLKRRGVAGEVLGWWDRNRRELPWRARPGETADPYRVWLSEILLQQTTAAGAAPYFLDFTRRWPDVEALAEAPMEEIMAAFAGLGYYSRARNLHACAKAVAEAGGAFPSDEAGLRALPGVGPYTAAAVAAIGFGRPAAPVDGNIARILSRLLAYQAPIPANRAAIDEAARALTPMDRAGDYAQALMDIGAMICRPRNPDCASCPLEEVCLAARSGEPQRFPARPEKKPRPAKVGAAFYVVRSNGAFLARRRPPKGLLGSTMELPGGAWRVGEFSAVGDHEAPFAAAWVRLPEDVEHVFTHFSLRLALFAVEAGFTEPPPGHLWIAPGEIGAAGFSGLMRKAAERAALAWSETKLRMRSDASSAKKPSGT
jgi:A/G-specific adenine glycosylase